MKHNTAPCTRLTTHISGYCRHHIDQWEGFASDAAAKELKGKAVSSRKAKKAEQAAAAAAAAMAEVRACCCRCFDLSRFPFLRATGLTAATEP